MNVLKGDTENRSKQEHNMMNAIKTNDSETDDSETDNSETDGSHTEDLMYNANTYVYHVKKEPGSFIDDIDL